MRRGDRAENGNVRLGYFQTLAIVGKDARRPNRKARRRRCNPFWLLIANADNLRRGMLIHLPQQIAHVHVVKINTNYPKLSHRS
jgi:hypothetical protein